jgi:hypothetical protein
MKWSKLNILTTLSFQVNSFDHSFFWVECKFVFCHRKKEIIFEVHYNLYRLCMPENQNYLTENRKMYSTVDLRKKVLCALDNVSVVYTRIIPEWNYTFGNYT